MLKDKILSMLNAWFWITGSILKTGYVCLVNFGTGVEKMATLVAMPGGLLLMAWMVIYTRKLFQIARL